MMYRPFQIRAARGIADWSQKELAERANLSHSAIRDTEDESQQKNTLAQTYEKIRKAFEAEAIYFTENGAEKRDTTSYEISGEGWWLKVLDDVYYTLMDRKDAEWLCMYTDDKRSPPDVIGRIRKIRNAGIKMRSLIEEGNTYMLGPVGEYRWVPKRYFQNYVTIIYGDKVATCAKNNTKAIVTKDPQLVETWKNTFELLWNRIVLKEPSESSANVEERY